MACSNLNPSQAASLRNEIAGALRSAKPPKPNVTSAEKEALKELKQNEDIMILPADKGMATVILDKDTYKQKMDTMLSDRRTYEILQKDPSGKYRNKLIAILQRLRNEEKITKDQYNHFSYPSDVWIPQSAQK